MKRSMFITSAVVAADPMIFEGLRAIVAELESRARPCAQAGLSTR